MNLLNFKPALQSERWGWVDYNRGIAIILVAFGHALLTLTGHNLALQSYPVLIYLNVFLYGFRMPLFFMIAGIFISEGLNKRGIKSYILYRTDRLLYPMLIWGIIEISLQVATEKYTHNGITSMHFLYLLIDPRQTSHFWFLHTLFLIGVVYAILKWLIHINPFTQVLLGLLMYIIVGYTRNHSMNAGLMSDFLNYYIFFALGDFLTQKKWFQKNYNLFSPVKLFFPFFILFLFLQYKFAQYNLNGSSEGIDYVQYKMPYFYLLQALVGCILCINLTVILQKFNRLTFIRIIGYYSIYIYLMQIIVMTVTREVLVHIFKITYIPLLFVLISLAGIFIPIVFYMICIQCKAWWFFTFRKPTGKTSFFKLHPIPSQGISL